MHSPPLRIAALIACFLLTSCTASLPPVIVQQPQLPAELQVLCPTPAPAPSGQQVDPVALELKVMYDLYGLCAGRHADLVNWLDRERANGR